MKKVFLLTVIFTLLISGCQFIPILIPTPFASIPDLINTPEIENTASPINIETLAVSTTLSQTFTPSQLPLPSATPTSLPLILQTGSPAYIQNFVHTDAGCSWLGIAGQIFDTNNQTINNLVVNIKGKLGQTEIDMIALTGIPEANIYGPGGYEIKLADKALISENTLRIQVFDINGNSLSKPMPLITYSDCDKNLVIINFLMK